MKTCLNVLIVEDEIIIAETLSQYLKERNHKTTDIVISYEDAVESLLTNDLFPDIILIDIRLYGEKSGIDLAKFISLSYPDTPYIFLTSQYNKSIVEKAMSTGPMGYLTKPILKESLWTTVEVCYNKMIEMVSQKNKPIELFDGHTTHRIMAQDILFVEADHIYSKVFLSNGTHLIIRSSLAALVDKFDYKNILKCHRRYLINLDYVERYRNNEVFIQNQNIPISRTYKNRIKEGLAS